NTLSFTCSILLSYSVFISSTPSDIYTLSLHDALPISAHEGPNRGVGFSPVRFRARPWGRSCAGTHAGPESWPGTRGAPHKRSRPCDGRGCGAWGCSTPEPTRPRRGTRVASSERRHYPRLTPWRTNGPGGQETPTRRAGAVGGAENGDAGWLRGQTTRRRMRCFDGGSKHRPRFDGGPKRYNPMYTADPGC